MKVWAAAVLLLTLVACDRPAGDADPKARPAAATNETPDTAATLVTDTWIGRWTGPEGLFLEIKPGAAPGRYAVTVKGDLDSQADYPGQADGEVIRFTRKDKVETIRAGVGAQTGFKYLADKRDCLIVAEGVEGYCRD